MDTVPITLKKVVNAPKGILDDEQLLHRILEEVKTIKAKKAGGEAPAPKETKAAAPKKPRKKASKEEVA